MWNEMHILSIRVESYRRRFQLHVVQIVFFLYPSCLFIRWIQCSQNNNITLLRLVAYHFLLFYRTWANWSNWWKTHWSCFQISFFLSFSSSFFLFFYLSLSFSLFIAMEMNRYIKLTDCFALFIVRQEIKGDCYVDVASMSIAVRKVRVSWCMYMATLFFFSKEFPLRLHLAVSHHVFINNNKNKICAHRNHISRKVLISCYWFFFYVWPVIALNFDRHLCCWLYSHMCNDPNWFLVISTWLSFVLFCFLLYFLIFGVPFARFLFLFLLSMLLACCRLKMQKKTHNLWFP